MRKFIIILGAIVLAGCQTITEREVAEASRLRESPMTMRRLAVILGAARQAEAAE